MKAIPNFITFSRIILSIILLFTKPLSAAFYTIYIICGFTDMIDGFIARKTGSISKLGAKLDSAADMVMAGVLLFMLYPVVKPGVEIIIWIILIAIIRFASITVAFKKYKTFASIHTYGNKITGIVLFLFPILLSYIPAALSMYIVCAVASISAVEELIIQLTSRELQLDRKSLFIKQEDRR